METTNIKFVLKDNRYDVIDTDIRSDFRIGTIEDYASHTSFFYVSRVTPVLLDAKSMRQIADKLDELNSKKQNNE